MKQAGSATNQLNPFANALKEVGGSGDGDDTKAEVSKTSLLSEALAQTGGQLPQENSSQNQDNLAEKQEKEAFRRKLNSKVNPVDRTEVFDTAQRKTKEGLEATRAEIITMIAQANLSLVNPAVEQTLATEIVNPGKGIGYVNFFEGLKVRVTRMIKAGDSSTWAQQMNRRGAKMPKGPGSVRARKTKSVLNNLNNNELNIARSGA